MCATQSSAINHVQSHLIEDAEPCYLGSRALLINKQLSMIEFESMVEGLSAARKDIRD